MELEKLNWSNLVIFGSAVMVSVGILKSIIPLTVIGIILAGVSLFMEK